MNWSEYKNFIIPETHSKLTFIIELKEINEYHNFLIKNLLKRDIYKKFGLDDYRIHEKIIHYFDLMEYIVESLLFSPFRLTYLCYYNGNIENYKKNIKTYSNKLNDSIYTEYYLNEKREDEEQKIKREEEKLKREEEKRKTQEEKEKEMWEFKRKCKKREYLSKGYYAYINYRYDRNEYWRKDDFTDSINSSGNFLTEKKEEEYKEYSHTSYDVSRSIIEYVVNKELDEQYAQKEFIDDYMWLDNYNSPNNVNLKVLLKQMYDLKKSILKFKIKIKHYKKYEPEIKYRKKHELYIKRFQIKLKNRKNHLKSIRKEAVKNYGYDKKSYEKDKKNMIKNLMKKIKKYDKNNDDNGDNKNNDNKNNDNKNNDNKNNDNKNNDNKNNDNKNNDNKNNDNKNNDNKNNDNKNNDNKNNDDKNNNDKSNDDKYDNKNNDDNDDNDDDNSEKCKFENCNREATYRKLKIGNCHLKNTKYEYCSYHRPKNSINKKFPYKSIFNKVNIPLHYFNHTNENILNDYHDDIYKTLKNNKFKFPIKITIYTENLLYDPFNEINA